MSPLLQILLLSLYNVLHFTSFLLSHCKSSDTDKSFLLNDTWIFFFGCVCCLNWLFKRSHWVSISLLVKGFVRWVDTRMRQTKLGIEWTTIGTGVINSVKKEFQGTVLVTSQSPQVQVCTHTEMSLSLKITIDKISVFGARCTSRVLPFRGIINGMWVISLGGRVSEFSEVFSQSKRLVCIIL